MTAIKTIDINDVGLVSFERSKRAKRIVISVKPFWGVRVAVPYTSSFKKAEEFVNTKTAWIKWQLQKMKRYERKYNDNLGNADHIDKVKAKTTLVKKLKLQQTQHWVDYQAADDALRSLIHESIKSNDIRAACHITAMLAQAYSSIYPMMRLVEGEEISTPIATSAEQLLEYSEKLALSLRNPSLRCFVMQTKAQLQFVTRDKGYEATLGEMKNIALSAKLRPFIKSADTLLQGMKSNEKELWVIEPSSNNNKTPLSLEEEAATIRSVAKMTRVDLEDDDDPIAQTINLAIRDLNPERIVKFCKHLHVQYTSSGGIYADQYGLGSAGGKVIYCELKDKAVEGMQLDGILEVFKLRSCKECKMRSPRPEKWKLTREWKRKRQANMPEGLIRYLRQAYG